MMYPIMTLNDETEIVHSEFRDDGNVKVYIEKPDEKDGFHNMTVFLPDYRIESANGFNELEIAEYMAIIKSVAHLILQFSKEGGFENASGF